MKPIKSLALIGILTSIHQTAFAEISIPKKINPTTAVGVGCQAAGGGDTCDDVTSAASLVAVGGTAAAVTGASGASIMNTMAVAGSVIGGGVVAGVGIVGGSGGFGAAHLMNKHLYSDCKNQHACDVAQFGTYTGAAAGTAASVGTLAVVGAGPVGLATIGAAVGGGMAAGATAVVAAPIIAAAAIGGFVYWLVK